MKFLFFLSAADAECAAAIWNLSFLIPMKDEIPMEKWKKCQLCNELFFVLICFNWRKSNMRRNKNAKNPFDVIKNGVVLSSVFGLYLVSSIISISMRPTIRWHELRAAFAQIIHLKIASSTSFESVARNPRTAFQLNCNCIRFPYFRAYDDEQPTTPECTTLSALKRRK